MVKESISSSVWKTSSSLFFLACFLYQLFFIFQGIDFSDDGFNSTFYQQIFNDPVSVQYNFMYWLSGVIGGAWLYLFPEFGLLGLRLGAVIVNTTTLILTYNLLKKYINPATLKTSLFFCLMFMSYHPLALFYDHLTALFFVIVAWFLQKGLTANKTSDFFIAGLFISVNSFTRLPNASGLALVVIIFYAGFINKLGFRQQLRQTFSLLAGFSMATVLILLLMHISGQYTIFMNCIDLVRNMSKSTESSHGLLRVIKVFSKDYFWAAFYAAFVSGLILLTGSVRNRIVHKQNSGRYADLVIMVVFTLLLIGFLKIKGDIEGWLYILRMLTGLSMISVFFIVTSNKDANIRTLTLAGSIIAFATTFGSDGAIMGAGRYSLWINLPIAFHFFLNASYYLTDHPIINLFKKNKDLHPDTAPLISFKQSAAVFKLVLVLIFGFFLFFEITHTWNDTRNRAKMTYTVDNDFLRGIMTTDSKAKAINELLQEISVYVKKGDHVLAYGIIPLFHSMTVTRPFIRNSWPVLYDQSVLKKELEKATLEQGKMPVVIYQKLRTVPNMNFPSDTAGTYAWDINQPANTVIREFLVNNHYQQAWENNAFRVYIREEKASVK